MGVPEDGYVYCTARDITDEVERNEALTAAVADRGRMWENSQDLNVIIDEAGTFLAINPATTKILGWNAEEIVGRSIFEYIVPKDTDVTQDALETATVGERPVVENRYRHKDGGFRWIAWVAAPAGSRIYATGRHITGEKEAAAQLAAAQEALRQSQKMEAVGQLTGGIAHDFNNIIAGVSGSLELMSTRLAQGRVSEVERYLTDASAATRRAAALTQRLLAFSRRQTLDPKPVCMNGLVDGMLELVNRSVGPRIAVETIGKAGLWNTFADPGQLESALLNLCINARDAMPNSGKITIETANRWMDGAAAKERALKPGQYVSAIPVPACLRKS
ncbi:MAG: sensor hybrid histidine kinase [Devosia sp.]|nr:sensor hybrid histidine kinase [Devosia sp.]